MSLGRKIRHLQRYRDIAKAFVRSGLGFIVTELGLPDMLTIPRIGLAERREAQTRSIGERVRMLLEELGPTFVKIGQIASTRPDLLAAQHHRRAGQAAGPRPAAALREGPLPH
ncbi:hypothetical protein LJK88_29820 [Paenibacillus sp. P26]|nr:hypothetical protein LJK88_29820 [Paenibacillus sp. P26]